MNNIRNKQRTLALSSNATSYVLLGDALHHKMINAEVQSTLGTLTSVVLSIVTRTKSDVDFWHKTLFGLRSSYDHDLTLPYSPDTAPMVGCHESLLVYEFDPSDSSADNGTTIIKPDSIDAADPGRWLESTTEYDNTVLVGDLTATVTTDNVEQFENIQFTGGTVYLKVVTSGTADSSSQIVINFNSK